MQKLILYFTILIFFLFNQNALCADPVTIDSTGYVGMYTSITIVNGNPAICYYDETNGDLKYVRASNTAGTSWNAPVTVDSTGDVGKHTSITIVNGNPAICYYDKTNGDLKYIRASNTAGTAWNAPVTVDSTGDVGEHTSITIVNGNPAICYKGFTKSDFSNMGFSDLKYVRASNANGTIWNTPVSVNSAAFAGEYGEYTSITIVNGNPAISYRCFPNLKYVRASNASGTSWNAPVTVDSTGLVGEYTSITIVNGNPAISYYDSTNRYLKYVRASNTAGTSWNAPVTVDSTGDVGKHTSISVVNGNPAISYYDYTNRYLKYVRASNASGDSWNVPVTIDSAGDVGEYTSMTIINGNPAISYYDSTNGNLKYATAEYTTGQMSLYFPHIACNAKWETEICIINTSITNNLTGAIKAYTNTGAFASSKSINLKKNGRRSFIVNRDFVQPSKIGYIIFQPKPNSTYVCGYTKFHVAGKYRVAIPATSQVNSKDIYIPHIASNNQWWTGLSLVNTTYSGKTITIEFNNSITKSVLIAANAHKVFTISSLFSGVSQPKIKSAVIKNGKGIIGLELFGSNTGTGKNYLSGILLSDETTKNLYYPHIASTVQWWTGIVAYNPATSPANLTIKPYKSDGTALSSKHITLQGKEKYMGTCRGLNLPEGTAWLHISSDKAITGFELFGKNNGNQLAGYTGVNINGKTGVFPKLEKAGWTGIAFINPKETDASVILTAFNDSGIEIANNVLWLNAHKKIVGNAETLLGKSISNATYITYGFLDDIVGFQLNGSIDGMLLDALPGH